MRAPADKPTAARQTAPAGTPSTWQALCSTAWRLWQPGAIRQACASAPDAPGDADAARHMWLAMASFMEERADALAQLEAAWLVGDASASGPADAAAVVHRALVFALLDIGAMEGVSKWLGRWDALAAAASSPGRGQASDLWACLAPLAAVALGGQGHGLAEAAAAAVLADLRRFQAPLSADEFLIAAQVLMEYQFTVQRFDAFDFLANAVESPPRFDSASPLMRARWLFTYGFSQHHTGRPDQAERAWQRALALAVPAGLSALALKLTLALARGMLHRGEVDAAQAIVDKVQPQWGTGRTAQLMEWQQLRARVQLLRGHAASALQLLEDALHTAEAAGLPRSECAACWSDLVQVYVALGRSADAEALLLLQQQTQQGRDALVSQCQLLLLQALHRVHDDPAASRQLLADGLALAQQTRYTMFFRLLPAMAAALAAMALRWQIAPSFVAELVRVRALPAPAEAGAEWPWPLWLRLLGKFEAQRNGVAWVPTGKLPQKPLELLRLLACQRGLMLGQAAAADALWPDADAGAARTNFDVTVHRLRHWLVDASLLWVADGQLGLDPTRVGVDLRVRLGLIDRIEALAMSGPLQANGADATGHAGAAECLALVERVVALTPGALMPGMAPSTWLLAEQARCSADTVRAALAAANVLQRAQATSAECALLETVLRIEPLSESLVARLMDAYSSVARLGDALRVYEAHCQLLRAHGAALSERLRARCQALLAAASGG